MENTEQIETVQTHLRRAGITQRQIAESCGVGESFVSKVVRLRERSGNVEGKIVELLQFNPFSPPCWRKPGNNGSTE